MYQLQPPVLTSRVTRLVKPGARRLALNPVLVLAAAATVVSAKVVRPAVDLAASRHTANVAPAVWQIRTARSAVTREVRPLSTLSLVVFLLTLLTG